MAKNEKDKQTNKSTEPSVQYGVVGLIMILRLSTQIATTSLPFSYGLVIMCVYVFCFMNY